MTTAEQVELGKLFFEEGLPGFQQLQFFQLIQVEPDAPFLQLQSIENNEIQFYVLNPFTYFKDYEFTLPETVKISLKLNEESPAVSVLSILSVHPNGQITANMKAPIVINQENRMAKQVILHDENYSVRQPLFQVNTKVADE